jgi:hypothetical protein
MLIVRKAGQEQSSDKAQRETSGKIRISIKRSKANRRHPVWEAAAKVAANVKSGVYRGSSGRNKALSASIEHDSEHNFSDGADASTPGGSNLENNDEQREERKLIGGITGKGFLPGRSGNLKGKPHTTGLLTALRNKIAKVDADGLTVEARFSAGEFENLSVLYLLQN